ncbi:MAG: hypothetical protein Q9190_006404 [Brigantiaea leucoxantha]
MQSPTLELLKHERSANAPELDTAATAPENSFDRDAPQAVFAIGPETYYNNIQPEAVPQLEGAGVDDVNDSTKQSKSRKLSARAVLLGVLIFVGLAAVAIGVGVGLTRKHQAPEPTPTVYVPRLTVTRTQPPNFTPRSTILKDSSFTALSFPNRDRRVFFQDPSGSIRQAFYVAATQEWTTVSSANLVTSNARRYTPMSAINVIGNENTGVRATRFALGIWDDDETYNSGILDDLDHPRIISNTSRSLTASFIPGTSTNEVYLCYESSSQAVTIIKGSFERSVDAFSPLPVTNESSSILSTRSYTNPSLSSSMFTANGGLSSPPQPPPTSPSEVYDVTTQWNWQSVFHNQQISSLQAPFSSSFDGSGVSAVFMESKHGPNPAQLTGVKLPAKTSETGNVTHTAGLQSRRSTYFFSVVNFTSANQKFTSSSDVLLLTLRQLNAVNPDQSHTEGRRYAFWVNGSSLMDAYVTSDSGTGVVGGITSPFPYARLGGIAQWNETVLYLYHQINDTTFVEDQFDETTGIWTSTNVTIKD